MQLPDDKLNQAVASILQQPGEVRDRLTEDMYIADSEEEITAQIETALELSIKSADLRKKLKKEGLEQTADIGFEDWLSSLTECGTISSEDSELLRETRDIVSKVINVDDFPQSKVTNQIDGGLELRKAG